MIVAIYAENYELSGYELHDGCPNDAIILIPLIEKLHSVKRMRMGDVIICDMGSNSLKIYITTINRFFVITIIYPGMNTNVRLMQISFHHSIYGLERVICLTFGIRSDQARIP